MFKRHHQAVSLDEPGLLAGMLKSLRVVLILSVVISIGVWGYLTVNDPATLPITKVRALGDFSYVTEDMLHLALSNGVDASSKLDVLENKGFFNIDVDVIKNRVEQMPWVKQASVQRVWPDTLVIEVIEHTPVAYWENDGLVSSEGKIFRPAVKTYPQGLPRFIVAQGIDNSLEQKTALKSLRYYTDATEMFSAINLKVVKVKFDARHSLTLGLSNGVELSLGRHNKLYRLQRFVQIYIPLRERMSLIERVDMRYTNGFSVKWKQRQATTGYTNDDGSIKIKSGNVDV